MKRLIPLLIFLGSGAYYYALSSKIYTWIYTSGDAGDWLLQLNWWMTPQCWGKPLYVLLVKSTNYLFFFMDDVGKITMLSVIGGAAIVMFSYLIARNLTGKIGYGLMAAVIVLGCNIVLTQSTVLEQYTVLGALFMAFVYYYQQGKMLPAIIFLGLTAATHEIGFVFTVLFIIVEIRNIRGLVKYIPIYALFGLLPYMLIVGTMVSHDTPKLLGGFFTFESINSYGGNTTTTAGLALTEAPDRFLDMSRILLSSLGFAIIPVAVTFKKPWDNTKKLVIFATVFVAWFYFTNLFPSVWKWLTVVIPVIVCWSMVYIRQQPNWQKGIIVMGAIALVITNTFWFNADTLAREKPLATDYYEDLMELPDGAAVITPRGGAYGFALFYAISDGKDLIPLALRKPDDEWLSPEEDQGFKDYLWWLEDEYGITGSNTYEITKDAMNKGHQVYYATPMTKLWEAAFIYEEEGYEWLYPVIDVIEDPEWIELEKL